MRSHILSLRGGGASQYTININQYRSLSGLLAVPERFGWWTGCELQYKCQLVLNFPVKIQRWCGIASEKWRFCVEKRRLFCNSRYATLVLDWSLHVEQRCDFTLIVQVSVYFGWKLDWLYIDSLLASCWFRQYWSTFLDFLLSFRWLWSKSCSWWFCRAVQRTRWAAGQGTVNCKRNAKSIRFFQLKMQKEWRIAPEKRWFCIEKWPFILQFEVVAEPGVPAERMGDLYLPSNVARETWHERRGCRAGEPRDDYDENGYSKVGSLNSAPPNKRPY